MAWSYNATTKRTDGTEGIIPRVHIEESIARLLAAGVRNRFEIVRVLAALSGLSKSEVAFYVDLVLEGERTCV